MCTGNCIFCIFICLSFMLWNFFYLFGIHVVGGTDVSSNQPPASFPHLGDQPLTTTNNFATLSTFPSFLFITTSIYRDGSTMCTAQCICQYSPRVDVCLWNRRHCLGFYVPVARVLFVFTRSIFWWKQIKSMVLGNKIYAQDFTQWHIKSPPGDSCRIYSHNVK